jgi:hypothetical protein
MPTVDESTEKKKKIEGRDEYVATLPFFYFDDVLYRGQNNNTTNTHYVAAAVDWLYVEITNGVSCRAFVLTPIPKRDQNIESCLRMLRTMTMSLPP